MSTNDDRSLDNAKSTLLEMISAQRARRTVLKGAVASLASFTALGTGAFIDTEAVFADGSRTKLQKILDTLVTVEQLAVTTYNNAFTGAAALGITGDNLTHLQTALIEEQIHELFLESLGAQTLSSSFSYPNGAQTFTDLATFIDTQQALENAFNSAYLAASVEAAKLNAYRLAQIFGQMACIEAEHRVLGRVIAGAQPANNYAYAPILVKSVADTIDLLTTAGFLAPATGNTYTYGQVSTSLPNIEYRMPFTV
ncbi:hypothetical protein KDA_03360 [Dictyobacter alpinus]|uniref:Ferritin-like domain-containing protein n=1 Tax=Dictyobacter alpinus TaxID=2014873 RepID=A0A402B0I8_9CHLR|nr:ferritin-like domain-containing protein [Dictyobacter alpinus]GCE24852.1 hypothetical protein KDA_03360 [Dictyobacter alpinus]